MARVTLGTTRVGLVGQQSGQFRRVTLTSDDISNLTIADAALSYDGDGRLLHFGLQAYSLGRIVGHTLPMCPLSSLPQFRLV